MISLIPIILAVAANPDSNVVAIDAWPDPPWVEIGWLIQTELDPDGQSGLTAATAELLRLRASASPALRGTVRVHSRHGAIAVTAGLAASVVDTAVPRISTQLLNPVVSEAAAVRAIDAARRRRDAAAIDTLNLAQQAVRADLFDGSPWARPPPGTAVELDAITAADISAFFRRQAVQARLRIRLAGPVEDFDWRPARLPAGTPPARSAPPPPRPGERLILIDKPGVDRAVVGVGRWPAGPVAVCRHGLRGASLGFGRAFWYKRAHRDDAVRVLQRLWKETQSGALRPTPDCLADLEAARRADRQTAVRAFEDPFETTPASRSPQDPDRTATVAVVVVDLRGGLTEALSGTLGLVNVSVVPYDQR